MSITGLILLLLGSGKPCVPLCAIERCSHRPSSLLCSFKNHCFRPFTLSISLACYCLFDEALFQQEWPHLNEIYAFNDGPYYSHLLYALPIPPVQFYALASSLLDFTRLTDSVRTSSKCDPFRKSAPARNHHFNPADFFAPAPADGAAGRGESANWPT